MTPADGVARAHLRPNEAERDGHFLPDDAPDRSGSSGSHQPDLRVFSAEERLARSQRRRARTLLAMSACVVAVAFLIVAAANIVVTSRQFRVDALSSSVSAAVAQNQNLQLQRAQLETPQRIIAIAEQRLGMIMPKSVIYLPSQPLPSSPAASSHAAGAGHSAAPTHGNVHAGGRAPTR